MKKMRLFWIVVSIVAIIILIASCDMAPSEAHHILKSHPDVEWVSPHSMIILRSDMGDDELAKAAEVWEQISDDEVHIIEDIN